MNTKIVADGTPFQPTNMNRVEYQNGGVSYKYLEIKKNPSGKPEYFLSMTKNYPGNIAIPPESGFVIKKASLGTDLRVAKNVLYDSYLSAFLFSPKSLDGIIESAKKDVSEGRLREKFDFHKLNTFETALDEEIEKVSPSMRPDFIKGMTYLSHLLNSADDVHAVAQQMIQFVAGIRQEYPSVFWGALRELSPHISSLDDLKRIGAEIINKDLWRMTANYFVQSALEGKMISVQDRFNTPYPIQDPAIPRALSDFQSIIDEMVKEMPADKRSAFLSSLATQSNNIINLESLLEHAEKNGLQITGTKQEALQKYQQQAKIISEKRLALANELSIKEFMGWVDVPEVINWGSTQFSWTYAYAQETLDLSRSKNPVIKRGLEIQSYSTKKPLLFPENVTIKGDLIFDNYHKEMPFQAGTRIEGNLDMHYSSFKGKLPDDLVVTGNVILHLPNYQKEEALRDIIDELNRVGLRYEVIKH